MVCGGNLSEPIFLVGTGRCGSTIIYSLLAMHPDLAWISSWVDAFPAFPVFALVNRVLNLPGMDRHRTRQFIPKPVEPNTVFSRLVKNYYTEILGDDVVEEARAALLPLLVRIQQYHGKPRFLGKMVGRPVKIELFAKLFSDAFFIHVTRKLKPTVSSFMQVDFYSATGTLDRWRWGLIPEAYLDYYEGCSRAEEVSAAIKVTLKRTEIEHQLERIDTSRWMELPYAEFVRAPVEYLHKVGKIAGLRIDNAFVHRLKALHVYGGADEKWRQFFNEAQVRNLDSFQALAGF